MGEHEPAAVADVRIIRAELVAMIAQGKRPLEIVGERFKPREMAYPLIV